jgi:glycolate oxidase
MATAFDDLPRALPGVEVLVDQELVEPFGSDHLCFRGRPGAVVRPESAEQVASLMALSAERGFAVVTRAAATNLCGSFVPRPDAVLLDMTKMNRIRLIDRESQRAVVEPGVINAVLQQALAPEGLCWSPDPASRAISSVGGNICTNAGGPGCIKYGVTFHHVHVVEAVLADGRVVEVRDTDPIDLLGVVIGSEGTLAVVTRAELHLRQIPAAGWTALASFARIEDATAAVSAIIAARIGASALELLDRRGVAVIDAWRPSGYPSEPEALLFAELDGEPDQVEAEAPRLLEVLKQADSNLRVGRTTEERAAIWVGRIGFAVATTAGGKRNFVHDVTVPRQRIPELVTQVRDIAARYHLDVPIVAHAGDGNVHPIIRYDDRERDAVFAGASEMTDAALNLGGTITGEHGVGTDKLAHMARRFTPAEIASFRSIKRAFDPQGRLNPGVLYPSPSRDEPTDEALLALVAAALSKAGTVPNAPGGFGVDATIDVDEENLTVRAGAAATCLQVRKVLHDKGLQCAALDGEGVVGEVIQKPDRRSKVRASLLAIDAEMAHGRVRFGSAAIKDVAGLDAKRLFTGCGGAPGTIERATFRAASASH